MQTSLEFKVINFIAEECKRQQSGELSVAYMCGAWLFAKHEPEVKMPWTVMIETLYKMVEPHKNPYGFRSQPVTVKGKVIPVVDFERVLGMLTGEAAIFNITPEEWYKEFQEIHAGNDGNGRVGAIMYNYLKGTMDDPVVPPDFFKDSSN